MRSPDSRRSALLLVVGLCLTIPACRWCDRCLAPREIVVDRPIAAPELVELTQAAPIERGKPRKVLDAAGVPYHYLEYGSYFKGWRERLALKMWTGWPTFPMVFVKGSLVGGADDVARLIDSGELNRLLA